MTTICNSPTLLKKYHVTDLLLTANISSIEYEFLMPQIDDRADNPPKGYLSVYRRQIEKGLRFPLHALVVEICNRLQVSPSQLTPEAHSLIVGSILCAKLYNLPPLTADCFFSLFSASSLLSEKIVKFYPLKGPGLYFLTGPNVSQDYWPMGEFFYLKPVGKSWNCLTEWRKTNKCSKLNVGAVFRDSFLELAYKSGMLKNKYVCAQLIHKDLLVHGGIEPGVPSPKFTFRYLMNEAAVTKSELLPEDIPHANATNKAANKSPLPAPPSAPEVTIHAVSSSACNDRVHLNELFCEREEYSAAPQTKKIRAMEADEAQPQSVPASFVGISKTLEMMFVPKDCYEKLDKEKQDVTSELTLMKSRLQKAEQANELYKAMRLESEHMTFKANVKVAILEKSLETLKSEPDCLRDKIKKDAIEEFKSSYDFTNSVHEEAVKYYINGFETCKLRVLNSGKLPSEFNFDFLDVADTESGSSAQPVDKTAVDLDERSLKQERLD